MELVARQGKRRRDGLSVEYPLTDNQGLFVDKDRRRFPDRRKSAYGFISPKVVPSKKSRAITNRLIFISLIVVINVAFIWMVYTLIVAT